jgi:hypothetical protein
VSKPEHIELNDWTELEDNLRGWLKARSFTRMVMFRNFDVGRLKAVLTKGTDRNSRSELWSAEGFDYDHEASPSGKAPGEVIYVHRVNPHTTPFTVLNLGGQYTNAQGDLTASLDADVGVSIYDSVGLQRVAHNEHWFTKPPLECLLVVYTLRPDEEA